MKPSLNVAVDDLKLVEQCPRIICVTDFRIDTYDCKTQNSKGVKNRNGAQLITSAQI